MCMLCDKRTFPYFVLAAIVLPITVLLLPDAFVAKLLAFLQDGADISIDHTPSAGALARRILFEGGEGYFGTARGVARLFFGLGRDGVETVASLYFDPASAEMPTFNFWLYRLLEGGLIAVALPVLLLFFLLQNGFSLLENAKNTKGAVAPVSGLAIVCGVITLSFLSYSWYDPAVFVIFFALVALLCANARYRRAQEFVGEAMPTSHTCAEFEFRIVKEKTRVAATAKQSDTDKEAQDEQTAQDEEAESEEEDRVQSEQLSDEELGEASGSQDDEPSEIVEDDDEL